MLPVCFFAPFAGADGLLLHLGQGRVQVISPPGDAGSGRRACGCVRRDSSPSRSPFCWPRHRWVGSVSWAAYSCILTLSLIEFEARFSKIGYLSSLTMPISVAFVLLSLGRCKLGEITACVHTREAS